MRVNVCSIKKPHLIENQLDKKTNWYWCALGMKPRIKNHFRAHQLSIWLRLIPELHRAGMEDVITRHNLFKNHDDMDLYDGPVKLDSLSRLAFLEETFKQRRNNGTNNEYSLLNINGKCWLFTLIALSFMHPNQTKKKDTNTRQPTRSKLGHVRYLDDSIVCDDTNTISF